MIEIDIAHAQLIKGLICSAKSENILEFGFGGGRSCEAILQAAEYNQNRPNYTLVDCWLDWDGIEPGGFNTVKDKYLEYTRGISLIAMREKEAVEKLIQEGRKFDFIMSDADHEHTHEWAENVFNDLLESPGILIYHDADNKQYPGIKEIRHMDSFEGSARLLFNRKTRKDEACERGLLVIFK